MKVGDVSRPRRLADPARLRWYAYYRTVRFARRVLGGPFSLPRHGPAAKAEMPLQPARGVGTDARPTC